MKYFLDNVLFKIIPEYALTRLLIIVAIQFISYSVTRLITIKKTHHSPALHIDSKIKFIPQFIYIYISCYAYWVVNFILAAHVGVSHFDAFFRSVIIGYIIGGIIFLAYPTRIDRPNVANLSGMTGKLVKLIYSIDEPTNLLPSFHCLISWYCWIAVRNCCDISAIYRIFSLFFTIIVCFSTVFVKQHFVLDAIFGIFIAEISWQIVNLIN